MIRKQELGDGVIALMLAGAGAVNTLDRALNADLAELAEALREDGAVRGVVIGSDKSDFLAGGDLRELQQVREPAAAGAIVQPFLRALRLLETSGKPVVAAMPGSALGGGLELALACHRRIAPDNPSARFGLPEVTLGLMPGGGGTQRLPRLLGLAAALPLLVEGRRLPVSEALALGLIDQIVPPEQLLARAKEWILANLQAAQPWDRKGFQMPGFAVQSRAGRQFFAGAWVRMRRSAGGNDEAVQAILQVLQQGLQRGLDAGIAIETRHFSRLAAGASAQSRIRTLFTGVNRARSMKARPAAPPAGRVEKLAVIGGGVMGRGIAVVAALAGIRVVLVEADEAAAARALDAIRSHAARESDKGRLRIAPELLLSRIETATGHEAIAGADFVVEAVFEQQAVKHEVLRRASQAVGPEVPIASNTSTMPIGGLATAIAHPERAIGLHFFSPVDRMPLVEVIRAAQTDDQTLARALDLLKQLGKTPVVVNDGLGFFTSRIVTTYSGETLSLIGEGVPPQWIDNAAVNAGFAIGGASLADLTTLPLLKDILHSMRGDGQRLANAGSRAEATVARLLELGRVGKVAGQGLFDYLPEGRFAWPGLATEFPALEEADESTIRRRLLHVQSLEAVRCLDDGIVASPLDGDVAAVLGWGYPSHLGGPFGAIDRIGLTRFVSECDALAAAHGARFTPPERLQRMAERGETFYE